MLVSTVLGVDAAGLGQQPRVRVVVGEPLDVVVERVQPGGGEARRPVASRRPSACAARGPPRSRPASRPPASRPGRPAPWTGRRPSRRRTRRTTRAGRRWRRARSRCRAPSRWTPTPTESAQVRSASQVREREHRAAGEVVGVLDRRSRWCGRRTGPCRGRTSPGSPARSTCPRGSRQVRIVSPVKAPCAPSSARAMWAEASHSTSCPARPARRRRARWPSSRSA